MKEAYIIAAYRTAVGKAPRGKLRFTRPDEMAAKVLQHLMNTIPQLDKNRIDDLIVGNAMPEAEQGLNVARLISLMGFDTDKVPGMIVNRYCASGSEAIAIATAKIRSNMADCIIAGGLESMSYVPMGGYKPTPHYGLSENHADYYWGMGLTAEAVADQYQISREDQDLFSYQSHQKALQAIREDRFATQIVPLEVTHTHLDEKGRRITESYRMDTDEGPRGDTSLEALARLKPVFAADGSVTAGNASQTSDGAAFLLIASEEIVKEFKLSPIAVLRSYALAGLEPRIMGMGPAYAVPKAIKSAGLRLSDIELIELNEAFASQSLAVIRELDLDPEIVNANGGAIALGHPLGCTGAKLSVQLFHEMKRQNNKYGLVTMCVGMGQGAASVFELL